MDVFFRKLFAGCLLCFILVSSYAQTAEVDSLKEILDQNQVDDSVKIDVLIQLSMAYSTLSPNVAEKYGAQALELAKQNGSLKAEANAHQACGVAYSRAGSFEKALECYFQSLKLNEQLGMEKNMNDNIQNIAGIYYFQQDYDRALQYSNRVLTYNLEKQDTFGIANSYHNLGIVYEGFGDFDKALIHYQKSLLKYRQLNKPLNIAGTIFNMGSLLQNNGSYNGALENYLQALKIYEKSNQYLGTINTSAQIGATYTKLGKYSLAATYLEQALTHPQSANFPYERSNTHLYFSRLDSIRGRYASSLQHYQRFVAIRDSLDNEKTQGQMEKIKTQFEVYQKEQELDLLQKEADLHDAEIQAKEAIIRNQYWLVFGISLLLIIGAGLFIYNNRQQNKSVLEGQAPEPAKELLSNQNIQWFSTLTNNFQNPMRYIQNTITLINKGNLDDQEAKSLLKDLESRTKYTSTLFDNLSSWTRIEMQQITPRPEAIQLATIVQGICTYYGTDLERKGLQIEGDIAPDMRVSFDQEMLHLVLRNLIGNSIIFSPSEGTLLIDSRQTKDKIHLRIKDEGASIPDQQASLLFQSRIPDQVHHSRLSNGNAIGLWLSNQLIQKNNGELSIESSGDRGITFLLSFPASEPSQSSQLA